MPGADAPSIITTEITTTDIITTDGRLLSCNRPSLRIGFLFYRLHLACVAQVAVLETKEIEHAVETNRLEVLRRIGLDTGLGMEGNT